MSTSLKSGASDSDSNSNCEDNSTRRQRRHPASRATTRRPSLLALIVLFTIIIINSTATTTSSRSIIGTAAQALRSDALQRSNRLFAKTMVSKTAASSSNKNSNNNESGVLKELKEKVKDQAKEIDRLRSQLKSAGVTKASSADAVAPGGHGGGEVDPEDAANYMSIPFYEQAFRRVTWLGIFLGSLALTALIMNGFEHTLANNIELAYFVPMLAGHGGNTGGQTVGMILSAMSVGAVKLSDAPTVIRKEAMAGVLSGVMLSLAVAPVAHFIMGISLHVSTVLLLSLPVVSTIASTLGSAIPFFCVFIGLDPSVIAAPAMTSFVDVTGLMSYFVIANHVFAMFGLEL